MERETIKFETSGKHTLEIKTFISGGEAVQIQDTYLEGAKVELLDGVSNIKELSPTIGNKVDKKKIELMVVSLDENKENILDRCLNLPNVEYQEILEKVNSLIENKKKES